MVLMAIRYFMPWNCHPSLAVTGAQCLASCLLFAVCCLEVWREYSRAGDVFELTTAGLIWTAHKLA